MGLSRLENFLKSVRGNILYVDPNSLDATDSIENKGNSLTRPFKTIQRALIESARFSYQRGLNNDRFGKTSILVYPGDHIIDNRPGWIPDGSNNFKLRGGQTSSNFAEFDVTTDFDVLSSENALYKLNSVHGGVIVPRGTSLVGLDLRKTRIIPKYVPSPTNDNIERSAIFRITGGCYFWQFSLFDADPNGTCYIDYTTNQFVPNFSHHKLTCFEYVDGVNDVKINDTFISNFDAGRTDLDMYYEKVALAYGDQSGRSITPDYPSTIDIEPKIDEYRIVGSTGLSVGISSIRAGDGVTATTTITVTTSSEIAGLEVDTPIRIEGVSSDGYDGSFVVTEKLSSTEIQYRVQNAPLVALPNPVGSTLSLSSDTVTSASPYIFNISLRSAYGMCGVLADGNKASGFKSIVIAQFTGISLQKDDNAFVLYDETSGTYEDSSTPGNESISTNSRAIFKPSYRNYHVKCINNAFIQNVSIFAIGYAEQFSVDSGGDQSITNSNSNFGSKSLVASGFRNDSFTQDDFGYITHIIPPKEILSKEVAIEYSSLDVASIVGVGTTNERLYLYNETNLDSPPQHVLEGFRVGARENDSLKVLISVGGATTEYSSRIVMQNSQTSSEKLFLVGKSAVGVNSITSNVITLTQPHSFIDGESIRILSNTGYLPDGLSPNTVYYAITSGLSSTTDIKVAKTLNDAIDGNSLTLNNLGDSLTVVSRVSDKIPGEIGHPIQFDSINSKWYIKVSTSTADNEIYSTIVGLGTTSLGRATSRTYIKRKKYNRNSTESIYKIRYVLPANTDGAYARPPSDAFILQESNREPSSNTEIQTYFNAGSITSINQQRNFRFISNATWDDPTNTVKVSTELPHNLRVGSEVELINITSSTNPLGVGNSGYNRKYSVVGINSAKSFTVSLGTDPGTFTNNVNLRTTSLPYFKKKKYVDTYYIYRNDVVQIYVPGKQDGIYHLTIVNSSNSPTVVPFTEEKFSQPVRELYPQINRDNPSSDPQPTKCFASSSTIGEVVVNDVRNSITKETIDRVLKDFEVGVGLTNVSSTSGSNHVIDTAIDHGFNRATKVNITYSGAGYVEGTYYGVRLVSTGGVTGKHANARVVVNASGNISNVRIMDGGSSYSIGDELTVEGIPIGGGFFQATIEVTQIYSNIGDTIRINGIESIEYNQYNDIYRITGISAGEDRRFTAVSSNSIVGYSVSGIGVTVTSNSNAYLTGKSVQVSSINYNNVTGFATVTTQSAHGFGVGNKIKIVGSTQSLYNGEFVITETASLTSFVVNIGISTSIPAVSGTIYVYDKGVGSNSGNITKQDENIFGRMVPVYAGISTTLQFEISDETTDEITINGIDKLDIKIGDYLQIDNELVRVKTTVSNSIASGDPIFVFRGVLGTKSSFHRIGTLVKRVFINPTELRRHSIIRASSHTFEYLGFGPGNYSTAFPDKQNRQISSQEELLAQSTRKNGGINFYTGMNDKGASYSGNKKLSSITGKEEVFDTPVQTITGEDISVEPSINIVNPIEGTFSRSIHVDGGDTGNVISEFNGPVVFNKKVTLNSDVEANSLYLQGDAVVSRKYTLGSTTPTLAGNPGDVQYNENPNTGGYVGWVYTSNNEWKDFGRIAGIVTDQTGVGVGTSGGSVGFSTLINFVGSNISIIPQYNSLTGITTLTFVGIASTSLLQGLNVGSKPNARWNTIVTVDNSGISSVGRYIDFYNTNTLSNYSYRLDNSSNGFLSFSGSLGISTSISLGGEINFTGANDKYIDFYTNDGTTNYTTYLRLINDANSSFHNGITLTRGGSVGLYYNNSIKLQTSSSGITVTGSVSATNGNFTGTVTATTISATNGNFTGIVTAQDINSLSDINYKTNIREIENPLDKILKIRGVNFDWKESNKPSLGVIAQEVEEVFPELVTDGEKKTVNYNGIIGALIEAIREQQKQIDDLKNQIQNGYK